MFRIVFWLARIILFPIYRYRFVGREHIPAGPCVVCGNHTALIDAVLVILALESRGHYAIISKAELFRNPVFAAVLRFVRAFPVRRGEGDISAIKTALQALRDGKRLIVFPEGTRVREGENAPPKAGAGMFAIRGGVPVVPVYLPGGKKAWRRNTLYFGPVMQPPQFTGRKPAPEDYVAFSQQIMARIHTLAPAQPGVRGAAQ